ncbi:MAG: hypothetical protein V3W51_01475, partial [Candidatus Brocadiales bacterium]
IAVLPFENLEGGNFKLNWVPVTSRDGEEEDNWSWTYSNRLRKSFFAYLSLREFELLSLLETDTVLKALDITNAEKLYNVDPRDLAAALGVDAVIYGKMTNYSAKYLFLYTQVAVGLSVRCVSGEDSRDLFIASEVRRDNKFRVALSPIDLIVTAAQNTLNVRKLHMARAADEVCREVVLSIPVAETLVKQKKAQWKELIASNQTIQDIKEKMAIANGSEAVLLADGAAEALKADDEAGMTALIKSSEDEMFLEGMTEAAQFAYANGAVRATESSPELDSLLEEIRESENVEGDDFVGETDTDSFTYIASAPRSTMDGIPHVETEKGLEIARTDILYSSKEDETIEIDASDIVYSNVGVVAENPADATDELDDANSSELEDIMNEIIEMSTSDNIYGNNSDLPPYDSAS